MSSPADNTCRPESDVALPRPGPIRRSLLAWYRRTGRDLPWRRNRTAWRVWISEMMLQQTTVATVLPRYEEFLRRFPTVASMAAAKIESVLAAWSGLGYYTRARNLHAAATVVMTTHGGRFPSDRKAVRALPGFGDYSTAAILSIVHHQALAVVDGNVIRVLARLGTLPGHSKSPSLKRDVQALADRLIDPESPGDFNQAIMELGATLCTPTSPRCGDCPVAGHCRARRLGVVADYPAPPPRKPTRDERWQVAVIESKGRVLMRQRPESERLMPGLWELPAFALDDTSDLDTCLDRHVAPGVKRMACSGRARHAIMNRRLELIVHRAELPGTRAPRGWSWINREEMATLPVSSMVTKALGLVDGAGAGGQGARWSTAGGKAEGTSAPGAKVARGKAASRQARLVLGVALALGVFAPALAKGGAEGPSPRDRTEIAADSVATAGDSVGTAGDTHGTAMPKVIIVPELAARSVMGQSVSLHRMLERGPVLLNFWALWCKPCLKELPELQGLQDQFGARGFSILSINGDSPADVAKVAPFVRARKLTFPVLTDLDGNLRRRFQSNAFPTSMLLDRTGRVAWTSQGYRPGDEVEMAKEIEELLGGKGGVVE